MGSKKKNSSAHKSNCIIGRYAQRSHNARVHGHSVIASVGYLHGENV